MRRFAFLLALGIAACNAQENLSTTEQDSTSIVPTMHDFGSLQVGQVSGPLNISINPVGFSTDDVMYLSYSCPDFDIAWYDTLPFTVYKTCTDPCDPCPLCAVPQCCAYDAASFTFTAQFHPTIGATVSCAVTAVMSSGINKTTTLTGTGTVPPIQIDVHPTTVDFGDVRRNTDSSNVTVSVHNAGGSMMTVSSVDITSGFSISSGNTGFHYVGAGMTEDFMVLCHPTGTGGISGSLNVHSDDPNFPTKSIPLSCNGIDSALDISPSPTMFGTTRVGEPVQQDVTLQNTGGASMNVESVVVSGTDLSMVGSPPTGMVGPGGTVNVTVAFSATTKGTASGTLNVTYDGGQLRSSPISARALATSMSVTPDGDVNFGPVCANQSKSQTFTVLANEEAAFDVNTLSNPGAPFTVSNTSLPFTVQGSAANKLMFDVTAMPTAAGDQTANLTLTTDIPNAATRTIHLSVSGIAAGISPSPASVDFGPNTIETTTIGQPVHLSNCSASMITFMRARIEGTDAADFAIVAQPDSSTLNPAASATWLVVFAGHSVGPKDAAFVVDYDGGTAMIPLMAEGVGLQNPMDPDETIDERSYYTCSSAGSSWGFVPFALVLLVWRRRRTR